VVQPQNLLPGFSIVHGVFNGAGKSLKQKYDMSTHPTEDDLDDDFKEQRTQNTKQTKNCLNLQTKHVFFFFKKKLQIFLA